MAFNVPAMLLKARASDEALFRLRYPAEAQYYPVQSVVALKECLKPITKKDIGQAKRLMQKNACLYPFSAFLHEQDGVLFCTRIDLCREVNGQFYYDLMPAFWHNGAFKLIPNVAIALRDGVLASAWSRDSRWDKLDPRDCDSHRAWSEFVLIKCLIASFYAEVVEQGFSAARRPMAAKVGWAGVRYKVADLSRRLCKPRESATGTHASPCRHAVRAAFFVNKHGTEVYRPAHWRGDAARGTVIRDWVSKSGLVIHGSDAV